MLCDHRAVQSGDATSTIRHINFIVTFRQVISFKKYTFLLIDSKPIFDQFKVQRSDIRTVNINAAEINAYI
jgi:hypothetical protein